MMKIYLDKDAVMAEVVAEKETQGYVLAEEHTYLDGRKRLTFTQPKDPPPTIDSLKAEIEEVKTRLAALEAAPEKEI